MGSSMTDHYVETLLSSSQGKSYTLVGSGPPGGAEKGILARSMTRLFSTLKTIRGRHVSVRISFLGMYCETLKVMFFGITIRGDHARVDENLGLAVRYRRTTRSGSSQGFECRRLHVSRHPGPLGPIIEERYCDSGEIEWRDVRRGAFIKNCVQQVKKTAGQQHHL